MNLSGTVVIILRREKRVSNGPFQFRSAHKIWPSFEFLTKIDECSQNFFNCLHARILVNLCSIAGIILNP